MKEHKSGGLKAFLKKNILQLTVLLAVCTVLCCFTARKEGFHMDELLSFELSNAEFNPWIVPTQPEGRLAKFVREEIRGESLGETLSNLSAAVADVLRNRSGSALAGYQADVYDEPVWITAEQFRHYITVEGEDAFNFLSVYFNVKDDNHPPLHFMLLHLVSSIWQGRAEPFMGCLINIAAVLGCCILLMWLGRFLDTCGITGGGRREARTGEWLGIAAALLYGLSPGAIATVLLIRMYGLMTFFCMALFAIHMKKWCGNDWIKHNRLLIAVTVLGFWTQYFFLFYCIVLALVTGVQLLRRRAFRELGCYIRSMAAAAVIGLAGFPFAVSDVFSSGRGVEALGNLTGGLEGYGVRLGAFGRILLTGMFGSLANGVVFGGIVLLLAVLALVLRKARQAPGGDGGCPGAPVVLSGDGGCPGAPVVLSGDGGCPGAPAVPSGDGGCPGAPAVPSGDGGCPGAPAVFGGGRAPFLSMLVIPPAAYFLLASKMSPYLVDRYIMAVFPFAMLAAASMLTAAAAAVCGQTCGGPGAVCGQACGGPVKSGLNRLPFILAGAAVLLTCLGNVLGYDGGYLYEGYARQVRTAREYASLACICVYDGVGYYENLQEFTYYSRTLLTRRDELEKRWESASIEALDSAVVLIKQNVDETETLRILEERYGLEPRRVLVDHSVYGDKVWLCERAAE